MKPKDFLYTLRIKNLRATCRLGIPVFWSYDPSEPFLMVINGVSLEFNKPVWEVTPLSLVTGIGGNSFKDPWQVVRTRLLPIVGDVRMGLSINLDNSIDYVWGDRLVRYSGRLKFGDYLDQLAGVVENPTGSFPKGFELHKATAWSSDGRPLFPNVREDLWESIRESYYSFDPLLIGQPAPQDPSDTLWGLWYIFETLGVLPQVWDTYLGFLAPSLVIYGPIPPGDLDRFPPGPISSIRIP